MVDISMSHITRLNKQLSLQVDDIIKELMTFPNDGEMEGAVNGLFLLHETYNLNWTEFVISNKMNINSSLSKHNFKLCSKDFEVLGKIAYKKKLYQQSFTSSSKQPKF